MKIAIVGAGGTVGRTLVDHFMADHEVLSVDPKLGGFTLMQAAKQADVVWIVTLPIEEVGRLLEQAASVMKPGSFLVHGTSVENVWPCKNAVKPKVAMAHIHFHFRPEMPLKRTLLGQTITVSLEGPRSHKLYTWFRKAFEPYGPKIRLLPSGRHDRLTAVSQLIHMTVSIIVNRVWKRFGADEIAEGLEIGGPPCKLLSRAVLRTGRTAEVAEGILLNHPFSSDIIGLFRAGLSDLGTEVERHEVGTISNDLRYFRSRLDPKWISDEDEITARLARLEADLNAARFRFRFPKGKNRKSAFGRSASGIRQTGR